MRIAKFKNDIERLKDEIMGQTLAVQLENGETLTIHEDDILGLLVEAINYQTVVDDGEVDTSHRQDIKLSEQAEKLKQAVPGQCRIIDTISGMLGGDDD